MRRQTCDTLIILVVLSILTVASAQALAGDLYYIQNLVAVLATPQ